MTVMLKLIAIDSIVPVAMGVHVHVKPTAGLLPVHCWSLANWQFTINNYIKKKNRTDFRIDHYI